MSARGRCLRVRHAQRAAGEDAAAFRVARTPLTSTRKKVTELPSSARAAQRYPTLAGAGFGRWRRPSPAAHGQNALDHV
eukprot:7385107-Prymnesium_polylepis.2